MQAHRLLLCLPHLGTELSESVIPRGKTGTFQRASGGNPDLPRGAGIFFERDFPPLIDHCGMSVVYLAYYGALSYRIETP